MRGATTQIWTGLKTWAVSIHAPREGSDFGYYTQADVVEIVSIHAPREGSDLVADPAQPLLKVFQSTPPVRGATSMPAMRHLR